MKLTTTDGQEVNFLDPELEEGDYITDAIVVMAVSNIDGGSSMKFTTTPTSTAATDMGLASFLAAIVTQMSLDPGEEE